MFDFFSMEGTYNTRRIERYEEGDVFVSTARVTDSDKPFETAIAHPAYNGGKLVVVELYDTRDEAQQGHERWVEKMTAKTLPDELTDVSAAGIALLVEFLSTDPKWRTYQRKEA